MELNKFKEEYANRPKQEDLAKDDLIATTETLKNMMSALPGINERKRILDMHMSIATTLLNHIKERHLDFFYTAEENIQKQMKQQVLEVLRDPSKGLAEDKLRFFIMFYLSSDDISDSDMAEYETALSEIKCPTHCLRYLKQVKGFGKLKQLTSQTIETSSSTVFGNFGFMLGDGVVDNAVQMLKAGVKSLKSILPSEKALPLTKVVESIVEGKPHIEADQYLYIDPKSKRNDARPPPKAKGVVAHQNVFVFVVGGGNYKEYLNLQEYAERAHISLTYGSTDMNRPSQFLGQINDLGNPNPKSELL